MTKHAENSRYDEKTPSFLLFIVVLIDKVHHHPHHHVLFLRAALGYHQRKGDKGVVGYTLRAISVIEDAIASHEPQEAGGGDALVAVAEGMVFRDQIEQQHPFLDFTRKPYGITIHPDIYGSLPIRSTIDYDFVLQIHIRF